MLFVNPGYCCVDHQPSSRIDDYRSTRPDLKPGTCSDSCANGGIDLCTICGLAGCAVFNTSAVNGTDCCADPSANCQLDNGPSGFIFHRTGGGAVYRIDVSTLSGAPSESIVFFDTSACAVAAKPGKASTTRAVHTVSRLGICIISASFIFLRG